MAITTSGKSQQKKAKTKLFDSLDEKGEMGHSPNFSYSFGLPPSGRGQDRDDGESFVKLSGMTPRTAHRLEDDGFDDMQRTNFGTSKDDSVGGYVPRTTSSSRDVLASSTMPGMSEAQKLLERLRAL